MTSDDTAEQAVARGASSHLRIVTARYARDGRLCWANAVL
jgi:hypothetical protein